MVKTPMLKDHVAAISCGIWQGTPVLDLDYDEDSTAETDANFVLTGTGGIVEIQGTAEGAPFSRRRIRRAGAAGPQGHRRARRPAEGRARRMMLAHGQHAGRRQPQSGQGPRDQGPAGALRHRDQGRRRTRPRRTGGDGHDFRRQCRTEGARGGRGERAAGAGRRFRSGGRPRWAARPASIRRAGPGPRKDFAVAMARDRTRTRCDERARPLGQIRLRAGAGAAGRRLATSSKARCMAR